MTNGYGLIHATFGTFFTLQKHALMNIYDGSLISVECAHRAKVISSEWMKLNTARIVTQDTYSRSLKGQDVLLNLAVGLDGSTSLSKVHFNGIKWVSSLNMIPECSLKSVTLMKKSGPNQILLASADGEIQLFNATDFKKESEPISLSIQEIKDVGFTKEYKHLLVAYKHGQVNLYETPNADRVDAGYNFIGQI